MEELKVKDVMTRGVVTVNEDVTVFQAVEILADYDITGLIVTDATGEMVGMISQTDVVHIVDKDLNKVKVKEVMRKPVVTVNREATLKEAAKIMSEKNIHRLVIAQEAQVAGKTKHLPGGIVSATDIVHALCRRK